jgi:YidC/Oxa1 family membrane protein insertase
MDRNTIIGLILMVGLFVLWSQFNQPTEEEIQRQQMMQDSLAALELQPDPTIPLPDTQASDQPQESDQTAPDTAQTAAQNAALVRRYGSFARSVGGDEQLVVLENELMSVTFTNQGGRIAKAEMKDYFKLEKDTAGKEIKVPLYLLEDEKNKFEYWLPVADAAGDYVSTSEFVFEVRKEGENAVAFRASSATGGWFEQYYRLEPNSHELTYELRTEGLGALLKPGTEEVNLHWVNFLSPLEKNESYERMYSTVYFKAADEGVDYCACQSDDTENINEPLKWISNANQFFNTSLIAETSFGQGILQTIGVPENSGDLKKLVSDVRIPLTQGSFAMKMYIGPNEFKPLAAYGQRLEDIIPFGWSFFGTINRWVIRPIFSFLSGFITNQGLVILALTLIVKIFVFPLTYKMLYSQSKMAALKPQLAKLKDKFKEDQQKQQMETMKMYREFGVNPLGGCFPVVLQMPIWFALYRFFPASIEFRQAGFLWATDLSSYDEFLQLPFDIPFYGAHVSLFTLIWVITTLIYTYYNSQYMDFSSNPMAKYMQFLMPVFFLFFFNNFASGLTAYLCFSNVINIGQTLVTKNYIIDQKKIQAKLEANKAKPKKKGGFQARLEKALKEQQKIQEEKKKKK